LQTVYRVHFNLERNKYAYAGEVRAVALAPHIQAMISREQEDFPPVVHPLVLTQAETGRKMLNLSPLFADHIPGIPDTESHELLSFLANHIRKEEFAYYHRWSMEDLVLWDNLRMWHHATGVAPDARRVMQRTTIAGDYRFDSRLQ
jgi:taurine dioxygenase